MRPQIVKNISLLLLHFLVSGLAMAQKTPPPPPQRTPPMGLPIDENLILLVLAGLILGIVFSWIKKMKATN